MWLENESPELDLQQDADAVQHESIVMAYLKFLFSWQMMFRLSDVGLGVLLSFFSTLLSIIGRVFQVDLLKFNDFAAKLPRSVRAAKIF